jgi:hypothetical protein
MTSDLDDAFDGITLQWDLAKAGPVTSLLKLLIPIGGAWADVRGTVVKEDDYVKEFINPSWRATDGRNPEALRDSIHDLLETSSNKELIEQFLRIVAAHLFRGLADAGMGNEDQAWKHTLDATYWLGVATGGLLEGSSSDRWTTVLENLQRARHRENNQIRDLAHRWLDENFVKEGLTNDDAAVLSYSAAKFR